MLATLRSHTLLRHLVFAVIAALAVIAVSQVLEPYRNYQLAQMAIYVCVLAGLTVLVGLSGQLSLGHGALMATGGYAAALTSTKLGDGGTTGIVLLVVPMIVGVVAAAIVGVIVGLAGARLHGPYLAGVTLTLTIIVPAITTTFAEQLGGDQGHPYYAEPAPLGLGVNFPLERWQAWICGLCAIVVMVLMANLVSGRVGREMRAVRDDPVAARLAGINVQKLKVLVFLVSASTAGLAGALLGWTSQSVSPGAFSLNLSLFLLMAVVVGGLGSLAGAVWGAVLLVVLPDLTNTLADSFSTSPQLAQRLDGNLSLLVFGVVLIGVILAFPRGLQGLGSDAFARLRSRRGTPADDTTQEMESHDV